MCAMYRIRNFLFQVHLPFRKRCSSKTINLMHLNFSEYLDSYNIYKSLKQLVAMGKQIVPVECEMCFIYFLLNQI